MSCGIHKDPRGGKHYYAIGVRAIEESTTISADQFFQVGIYVGTVIGVDLNPKAKKPAYHITVDFGHLGIKESSAQLTVRYRPEDLIGRQIMAVTNLPVKKVAGVRSEVLILGAVINEMDVVLLNVDSPVPNGTPIG